jgi:cytochrome b
MCAVATSLIAGEFGYMDIHVISGHVVMALIIFRLAWGVFGGKHARFLDFIKGPKTVLTCAKRLISGDASAHRGHNPMGALSVVGVLAVLIVQVTTGLFTNDDILTEGPLAA